jgi:hypothetical protein
MDTPAPVSVPRRSIHMAIAMQQPP